MTLNAEWRDRLNAWRTELKNHLYRPLGNVELAGFATTEQLDADEAAGCEFAPMPPGARWGAKWEYGWFRGRVVVPEAAAGEQIVVHLPVTDREAVVYVNGSMTESHRGTWGYEVLTAVAAGGEVFDLLLEAAAWHGPTPCHVGPNPPDRPSVPQTPPTQQIIGECSFGIWNELAYQLHIDVETLLGIRDNLDADLLRVAEIDRALKQFTLTVDFELPFERMNETFAAARDELRPVLACHNGSTAPEMFCFGHAHLDVAWLWPLAETERKAARTLANQLALTERYPEHRFLHSQPHLFRMVKRRRPELYERVKRAIADGSIIAEGGMWVEADTNISGGESLIRQFLYGKRFFKAEFGVDSEILWLPDVFGYSGALPQILAGCGIRYFTTAKIFWNYHGGDPFPYHNFIWEGIDGSEVIAHLHHDYNSTTDPAAAIRRWKMRVQKDGMSTRLFPFGWGDGGGGPTRDHLEYIRRLADCEGSPKMRLAAPGEFFADLVARGEHDTNRYVGELYYQCHRGVLTSQAKTKRGNRKCELALREAEMWTAAAAKLGDVAWPRETLDEAWQAVLLNQFHDILPGSSMRRVYEEAEADYDRVLATATELIGAATGATTADSPGLTVFNSLGWPRTALVPLPAGATGATDHAGRVLPAQTVGGATLVEAEVPPCGWTTLRVGEASGTKASGVTATETTLENDRIRIEFDAAGEMVSMVDKTAGRELLAGVSNVLRMYKDVPGKFDAWDIDSMYVDTPVDLGDAPATIEVIASGPLVAILRITRRIADSTLTQDVRLRADQVRVDFDTTVEWRESHKLLKVGFTPDIHANEAIHEIQFGHIRRPNHASRPFDADRYEVCNHKWTALAEEGRGFAVLNDCKYGVSARGKSINLTLLRAPLGPDDAADRGAHRFTYAALPWVGSFASSPVVREGYDLNVPVVAAAGSAGERSLLSVDAANVVIETVKLAEDGSGDLIVRLYESKRTATACILATSLPIRSACATDMLENDAEPLDTAVGAVPLELRPFEIKTVRLRT